MLVKDYVVIEPLANGLLRHEAHHPRLFLPCSFSVETHDVAAYAPEVLPVSVKELPPTILWHRGESDAQMPRRQ